MKTDLKMTRCGRVLFGATVLAAIVMLGGCETGTNPDLAGPAFPESKALGPTLDVQVVRVEETSIRLTNTSARAYGKSRLWLNRWFSRDIDTLDVGQTLEFPLSDFRDQYGEAFRGGGFFATRKPERLVQAQLETADSVIGLVVVALNED